MAEFWLTDEQFAEVAPQKTSIRSVRVARQQCGALGKRANCQSLVFPTVAKGEVPVPLGLRLFLAEEWMAATVQYARAGVPGM